MKKSNNEDIITAIYEIVRLIPFGRVSTYGAIAKAVGMPTGARFVGYVMNLSHQTNTQIPAHRVVNRIGLLTGKFHFKTPNLMEELLKEEGIVIKNNQIIGFEKHFWDPTIEVE
jgi:methylated-DNA-protein-cysteine methyltransferase-like protein